MERPPIIPIATPAEASRPPRIAVPGAAREASPKPSKKGKGKKAAPATTEGESPAEPIDPTDA